MRIDIDLDYNRIVAAPGTREPIAQLIFKRDTAAELAVYFWKNGARVALPDGATGKFGIKAKGKFDGTLLVIADSWTQTGTGADAVYTFEPAFNGEALADLLFSGDGNENNDLETLFGISEIKWIVAGKKNRSQTVPTIIENDVLKDEDGTPLSLPTPDEWLAIRIPPPLFRTEIPISPRPGDNGTMTFVPPGDETVADGDYIDFEPAGFSVERWTFRDVADPVLNEIQIQSAWNDTIYIFGQQLRAKSAVHYGLYFEDEYDRPCLTLVPKVIATGFGMTLSNYSGVLVDNDNPAGSPDTGLDFIVPDGLGQSCFVMHPDGTRTEWSAVSVTPPEWLPRTAGILRNRAAHSWHRAYIEGTTIQLENIS